MDAKATILGMPDQPTATEVPFHKKPTTESPVQFTAPVGFGNLPITRVKEDKKEAQTNGKIHYWLKLEFPGGADGWVRDDWVGVEGNMMASSRSMSTGLSDTDAPISSATLRRLSDGSNMRFFLWITNNNGEEADMMWAD